MMAAWVLYWILMTCRVCWAGWRRHDRSRLTFAFLDGLVMAASGVHLALCWLTNGIKPATGDMVKGA